MRIPNACGILCTAMPNTAVQIREFKARAEALFSEPGVLDLICAHVADGGTLIDFCKTRDLRYSDVVAWLYRDPGRKSNYEEALHARGEWAVERVLEEIRTIAMMDVETPGTKARYGDKLKALELLGKNSRLFTDRIEHEGGLSLEDLIAGSMAPPDPVSP